MLEVEAGRVSLAELFDGHDSEPTLDSDTSVREALDALVHGGWPGDRNLTVRQAQRHLRDYVDDIVNIDVGRLDGEPRRDPLRMRAFAGSPALKAVPLWVRRRRQQGTGAYRGQPDVRYAPTARFRKL